MVDENGDVFGVRLNQILGWGLFLGLIGYHMYTGFFERDLLNQQGFIALGIYTFAGIMIKPDLVPHIVEVVRAFKGKS